MLQSAKIDEGRIDNGIAEFRDWSRLPDAALWYCAAWAEAVRPG